MKRCILLVDLAFSEWYIFVANILIILFILVPLASKLTQTLRTTNKPKMSTLDVSRGWSCRKKSQPVQRLRLLVNVLSSSQIVEDQGIFYKRLHLSLTNHRLTFSRTSSKQLNPVPCSRVGAWSTVTRRGLTQDFTHEEKGFHPNHHSPQPIGAERLSPWVCFC